MEYNLNKHPEYINKNGAPKKDNSWRAIMETAYNEIVEQLDERFEANLKYNSMIKGLNIEKKTFKEAVAKILRRKALTGDLLAMKMSMDRMDGYPKQETLNLNANITDKTENEIHDLFKKLE